MLLLVALIAVVLMSACAKRTNPVLSDPSAATTSVSIICPQIENYNFPDNRVFVSVVDQSAVAIKNFELGNFVVSENGQPAIVFDQKNVDNNVELLSTVIVIDRSGSMGSTLSTNSGIFKAKKAAVDYVNTMSVNDYAEIVLYDDLVEVPQTFTNDKALLLAAIATADGRGSTATYDGIIQGVTDIARRSGRKTLLVLTDGDDNSSSHTEAQCIIDINKAGIAAFCVGLGSGANMTSIDNISLKTSGRSYQTDDAGTGLSAIFTYVLYLMNNLVEVDFRSRIGELKPNDNTRDLTVYLNYGTYYKSCTKTYGY